MAGEQTRKEGKESKKISQSQKTGQSFSALSFSLPPLSTFSSSLSLSLSLNLSFFLSLSLHKQDRTGFVYGHVSAATLWLHCLESYCTHGKKELFCWSDIKGKILDKNKGEKRV